MDLSITEFVVCIFIISGGAVLQASTGLGAGLVIVPLLALVRLDLVPGPVIFASLVLSFLMAYQGKAHIKSTQLDKILLGLSIGAIAGSIFLAHYSLEHLGLLFGVLILVAVLISGFNLKPNYTPINLFGAGTVSGFMGTTAAIGAPILAMLYQYESGKVIRATLGLLYFVSSIIMLLVLYFAGLFSIKELMLGIALIPGFIIGYLLAGNLVKRLDKGYSRFAVLTISATSAFVLIAKNI